MSCNTAGLPLNYDRAQFTRKNMYVFCLFKITLQNNSFRQPLPTRNRRALRICLFFLFLRVHSKGNADSVRVQNKFLPSGTIETYNWEND